MSRFFNTSGPCEPKEHYMLPAEERLSDARRLIDLKRYFVLHAPRQTGKTTTVAALVASLTAEGRYTALLASCEEAQAVGEDIDRGIALILNQIEKEAADLPEALKPPPAATVADVDGAARLGNYLTLWAQRSPRPLVLFLDEIDSMMGRTLISVLRQLRVGYRHRPGRFPQTVALVGMRDVRDYKITKGEVLHTSSPYNVKDRSFLLPNFTAEEVVTLVEQHSDETGQVFTDEVKAGVFELTRGQPWLVNALARQLVEDEVPDLGTAIERGHLEAAKEALIQRRETHLDSLIDRLREDRVRRVVEPIVAAEYPFDEVFDDDIQYVKDLGLVAQGDSATLEIANPIYREVVPRALTAAVEAYLPVVRGAYVAEDGSLLFTVLLEGFVAFWRRHAEHFLGRQPYSEAAAQLIFMAFLQKIVNGGARAGLSTIDREYAVGAGRIDLHVRWPLLGGDCQRFAVELKVWRDKQGDPLEDGKDQLADYLERLDLPLGTLLIFDQRSDAPPLPKRISREELEHRGRRLTVQRL